MSPVFTVYELPFGLGSVRVSRSVVVVVRSESVPEAAGLPSSLEVDALLITTKRDRARDHEQRQRREQAKRAASGVFGHGERA